MGVRGLLKISLCLLLSVFFCGVRGLKCRTATDSQQNNDFEYVVRMCLRHLKNESDIYELYKLQGDNDYNGNKRHRYEMSGDNNSNGNGNNNNNNGNNDRNYYNRNRGYPEGFDRFWPSNNGPYDRNRYGDEHRYRQDGDYPELDYFGNPTGGKDGRKKSRGRPQMPHSYQQQLQHDREMYGRGSREPNSYFYSNKNKSTKLLFNKDRNIESPLADIDACVIHCIFQEMQMVDDNGRPNKGLISEKMTQKIRNSELKNFIQESVEECFDAIDDNLFESNYNSNNDNRNYNSNNNNNNNNNNSNNNNGNSRYRRPEAMCDWAKTFAMCLEDKGRDNCDDWNEPMQKNQNGRNNDDQRHKSKQNDRG